MLGVESSSCSFESSPNNTIKFDEDDIININSTIASNDQHEEHQDNSSLSQPNSSNSSELLLTIIFSLRYKILLPNNTPIKIDMIVIVSISYKLTFFLLFLIFLKYF